jgi:hypothetical protein
MTIMKKIKHLLFITLLTITCGPIFSQTVDSLTIYPNPFNSATTIHFDLVQTDTITLQVFNPLGQTVRTFYQSTVLPSGSYHMNLNGDSLLEGVYFIKLEIGSTISIVKKAIKFGPTSIVENYKLDHKLIAFPNPTNDRITIPIQGNKTIIVADMHGNFVKSFTTDQQVISLLDIAAGQYVITILDNENKILTTQKMIKRE